MHKVTINTSSYNEKRYGKPYIGKVDIETGRVILWGTWIGQPGYTGMLEIQAKPGDVLIDGQKDNRGNNSTSGYWLVTAEGQERMSKVEAIRAAREIIAAAALPSVDDELAGLIAQRDELNARIAALQSKNGQTVAVQGLVC